MSLDGDAKLGDVMKKLSAEHGIEVPKLLGLEGISEFEVLSAFFDQFSPWESVGYSLDLRSHSCFHLALSNETPVTLL